MAGEHRRSAKRKPATLKTYTDRAGKRSKTLHAFDNDDANDDGNSNDQDERLATSVAHTQDTVAVVAVKDAAIEGHDPKTSDQSFADTKHNADISLHNPDGPTLAEHNVNTIANAVQVGHASSHQPNPPSPDEQISRRDTSGASAADLEPDESDGGLDSKLELDGDGDGDGDSAKDSVSPHQRSSSPSGAPEDTYYAVRRILKETKAKYLIDWEDGPKGQKYPSSWEPKSNANKAAVQSWEQEKENKKAKSN